MTRKELIIRALRLRGYAELRRRDCGPYDFADERCFRISPTHKRRVDTAARDITLTATGAIRLGVRPMPQALRDQLALEGSKPITLEELGL